MSKTENEVKFEIGRRRLDFLKQARFPRSDAVSLVAHVVSGAKQPQSGRNIEESVAPLGFLHIVSPHAPEAPQPCPTLDDTGAMLVRQTRAGAYGRPQA